MPAPKSAQSALDLLVLTILPGADPSHGYGLANAIQELSEEALRIEEGSLYPALHRMEEAGWISAEWVMTEKKRRARIYEITETRQQTTRYRSRALDSLFAGVALVLRHA